MTQSLAMVPQPELRPVEARTASSPALVDTDRPVVLVLHGPTLPTATLQRAAALARAERVMLQVVLVLPRTGQIAPLFPQDAVNAALGGVTHEMSIVTATSDWLVKTLGHEAVHVRVETGELFEVARRVVDDTDASLVVLPPGQDIGGAVAALAVATHVPVLVGREPTTDESIVAATDLEHPSHPVLWDAALLAARLDAPLVALHTLEHFKGDIGADLTPWVTFLPSAAARSARERMTQAASHLPVPAAPVLTEASDPADGILQEARAIDADVIAVGAGPRSWLEGLTSPGVAADVVDRARRSVLVVPVSDGSSVQT